MRGSVIKRGKKSYRLKFDVGTDPLSGKRKIAYKTVRGTKAEAEAALANEISAFNNGGFVEPTKVTVAEWLRQWLPDQHGLAPKTAERYQQLIDGQIVPHLGKVLLQKLRPAQIKAWHGELLKGGLHPRTVGHAHRVLRKALGDAMGLEVVSRNVVSAVAAPTVEDEEIIVLSEPEIADTLTKLRGRSIFPIAVLALATGMRRGELLALRWSDVDLDNGRLCVERSLEETKAGLRFKSPKTKRGRRTIKVQLDAIDVLRQHRKQLLEQRMMLGLGKMPADALVFPAPATDNAPRSPRGLTKDWSRTVDALKLPDVTFHALRHTHVSILIRKKVDILTISRRIGHSSPSITLSIYGHLISNTDDEAAALLDGAFGELQ